MKNIIIILLLLFCSTCFADEIRIQIIFKADTPYGTYQDALWFTQEEYSKFTQEDIDRLKQERINNWISVMSTPQPEQTKEEKLTKIQSQIDEFNKQIQELQNDKYELNK